jgi:hypothetical protein
MAPTMLTSAKGREGLSMPKSRITAAICAGLTLLASAPGWAADQTGIRTAAEELTQRTKPTDPADGQSKGLSDSAVRVFLTYAQSILPEEAPGPDGKMQKVDKSDPNKFLIPIEDARRVIRAATRSAYAEACQLLDLQRANYQALMKSEEAKKTWSREQLLMINALHLFSTSYFAGTVQIAAKEEAGPAAPAGAATALPKGDAGAAAQGGTQIIAPKPPACPPEQKQKVENAINAYVQAAQAAQPNAPAPRAATGPN